MSNGQATIEIPVAFRASNEEIKRSVQEIQKQIDGLKPGDKLRKGYEEIFETLTKKMKQIEDLQSGGKLDNKGLEKNLKLYEEIRGQLTSVRELSGKLGLENLQLPDGVLNQLKEFEQRLAKLKTEVNRTENLSVKDRKDISQDQKEVIKNKFGEEALNGTSKQVKTMATRTKNQDIKDLAAEKALLKEYTAELKKAEEELENLRKAQKEAFVNNDDRTKKAREMENRAKSVSLDGEGKALKIGDFRQNVVEELRGFARDATGALTQEGELDTQTFLKVIGLDDATVNEVLEKIRSDGDQIQDAINQATTGKGIKVSSIAGKGKRYAEGIARQVSGEYQEQSDPLITDKINEVSEKNRKVADSQDRVKTLNAEIVSLRKLADELKNKNSQLEARVKELEQNKQDYTDKTSNELVGGKQGAINQSTENIQQAVDIALGQGEPAREALRTQQSFNNLSNSLDFFTSRFLGINQVFRMVSQGIRSAMQDIKALDKAMTDIAVVTNMTTTQLWQQIDSYMALAQQYGVTTQGVYQVSQIFYQQGLATSQVTELTAETLKMARIAGMDYKDAADGMTVAIRAFKLEMSDAAQVTDVYSKVASITASSSQELIEAMSKTASGAANVGASFENTTAMIATMVEATRESAVNIGSALKSIIARYGEMKVGNNKDENGELIDYNKTDAALKSIGISIKDAQGQFRDFDDVIDELAEKWDSLDSVTQRYVATVMAGNRQQSRFIALVSSGSRLKQIEDAANNSEDAGLLQYSKTLDSLESKLNQVSTSFQQFYMKIANGNTFKGAIDWINKLLQGFNKLSGAGKAGALLSIFNGIKTGLQLVVALIKSAIVKIQKQVETSGLTTASSLRAKFSNTLAAMKEDTVSKARETGTESAEAENEAHRAARQQGNEQEANDHRVTQKQEAGQLADAQNGSKLGSGKNNGGWKSWGSGGKAAFGSALSIAGSIGGAALTALGTSTVAKGGADSKIMGAGMNVAGNALSGAAAGAALGPWGALAGGVLGALSGLPDLVNALDPLNQATANLEQATKELEEARIKGAESRNNYKNLISQSQQLSEAEKIKNLSQENYQSWIEANSQIVESFPQLLDYYDEQGNAIANIVSLEEQLSALRQKALEDTREQYLAELKKNKQQIAVSEAAIKDLTGNAGVRTDKEIDEQGTGRDFWDVLVEDVLAADFLGPLAWIFNPAGATASLFYEGQREGQQKFFDAANLARNDSTKWSNTSTDLYDFTRQIGSLSSTDDLYGLMSQYNISWGKVEEILQLAKIKEKNIASTADLDDLLEAGVGTAEELWFTYTLASSNDNIIKDGELTDTGKSLMEYTNFLKEKDQTITSYFTTSVNLFAATEEEKANFYISEVEGYQAIIAEGLKLDYSGTTDFSQISDAELESKTKLYIEAYNKFYNSLSQGDKQLFSTLYNNLDNYNYKEYTDLLDKLGLAKGGQYKDLRKAYESKWLEKNVNYMQRAADYLFSSLYGDNGLSFSQGHVTKTGKSFEVSSFNYDEYASSYLRKAPTALKEEIESSYYQFIKEELNKVISSLGGQDSNLAYLAQNLLEFTGSQLDSIIGMMDVLNKQINSTSSLIGKRTKFSNRYNNISKTLQAIESLKTKVSDENYNKIFESYTNFMKEGTYQAYKEFEKAISQSGLNIKNLGIDSSLQQSINELKNTIYDNITVLLEQSLEQVDSTIENISKVASAVSKGYSFEEAQAIFKKIKEIDSSASWDKVFKVTEDGMLLLENANDGIVAYTNEWLESIRYTSSKLSQLENGYFKALDFKSYAANLKNLGFISDVEQTEIENAGFMIAQPSTDMSNLQFNTQTLQGNPTSNKVALSYALQQWYSAEEQVADSAASWILDYQAQYGDSLDWVTGDIIDIDLALADYCEQTRQELDTAYEVIQKQIKNSTIDASFERLANNDIKNITNAISGFGKNLDLSSLNTMAKYLSNIADVYDIDLAEEELIKKVSSSVFNASKSYGYSKNAGYDLDLLSSSGQFTQEQLDAFKEYNQVVQKVKPNFDASNWMSKFNLRTNEAGELIFDKTLTAAYGTMNDAIRGMILSNPAYVENGDLNVLGQQLLNEFISNWVGQAYQILNSLVSSVDTKTTYSANEVQELYSKIGDQLGLTYEEFSQAYFSKISGSGVYRVNWNTIRGDDIKEIAYTSYLETFGFVDDSNTKNLFDNYWGNQAIAAQQALEDTLSGLVQKVTIGGVTAQTLLELQDSFGITLGETIADAANDRYSQAIRIIKIAQAEGISGADKAFENLMIDAVKQFNSVVNNWANKNKSGFSFDESVTALKEMGKTIDEWSTVFRYDQSGNIVFKDISQSINDYKKSYIESLTSLADLTKEELQQFDRAAKKAISEMGFNRVKSNFEGKKNIFGFGKSLDLDSLYKLFDSFSIYIEDWDNYIASDIKDDLGLVIGETGDVIVSDWQHFYNGLASINGSNANQALQAVHMAAEASLDNLTKLYTQQTFKEEDLQKLWQQFGGTISYSEWLSNNVQTYGGGNFFLQKDARNNIQQSLKEAWTAAGNDENNFDLWFGATQQENSINQVSDALNASIKGLKASELEGNVNILANIGENIDTTKLYVYDSYTGLYNLTVEGMKELINTGSLTGEQIDLLRENISKTFEELNLGKLITNSKQADTIAKALKKFGIENDKINEILGRGAVTINDLSSVLKGIIGTANTTQEKEQALQKAGIEVQSLLASCLDNPIQILNTLGLTLSELNASTYDAYRNAQKVFSENALAVFGGSATAEQAYAFKTASGLKNLSFVQTASGLRLLEQDMLDALAYLRETNAEAYYSVIDSLVENPQLIGLEKGLDVVKKIEELDKEINDLTNKTGDAEKKRLKTLQAQKQVLLEMQRASMFEANSNYSLNNNQSTGQRTNARNLISATYDMIDNFNKNGLDPKAFEDMVFSLESIASGSKEELYGQLGIGSDKEFYGLINDAIYGGKKIDENWLKERGINMSAADFETWIEKWTGQAYTYLQDASDKAQARTEKYEEYRSKKLGYDEAGNIARLDTLQGQGLTFNGGEELNYKNIVEWYKKANNITDASWTPGSDGQFQSFLANMLDSQNFLEMLGQGVTDFNLSEMMLGTGASQVSAIQTAQEAVTDKLNTGNAYLAQILTNQILSSKGTIDRDTATLILQNAGINPDSINNNSAPILIALKNAIERGVWSYTPKNLNANGKSLQDKIYNDSDALTKEQAAMKDALQSYNSDGKNGYAIPLTDITQEMAKKILSSSGLNINAANYEDMTKDLPAFEKAIVSLAIFGEESLEWANYLDTYKDKSIATGNIKYGYQSQGIEGDIASTAAGVQQSNANEAEIIAILNGFRGDTKSGAHNIDAYFNKNGQATPYQGFIKYNAEETNQRQAVQRDLSSLVADSFYNNYQDNYSSKYGISSEEWNWLKTLSSQAREMALLRYAYNENGFEYSESTAYTNLNSTDGSLLDPQEVKSSIDINNDKLQENSDALEALTKHLSYTALIESNKIDRTTSYQDYINSKITDATIEDSAHGFKEYFNDRQTNLSYEEWLSSKKSQDRRNKVDAWGEENGVHVSSEYLDKVYELTQIKGFTKEVYDKITDWSKPVEELRAQAETIIKEIGGNKKIPRENLEAWDNNELKLFDYEDELSLDSGDPGNALQNFYNDQLIEIAEAVTDPTKNIDEAYLNIRKIEEAWEKVSDLGAGMETFDPYIQLVSLLNDNNVGVEGLGTALQEIVQGTYQGDGQVTKEMQQLASSLLNDNTLLQKFSSALTSGENELERLTAAISSFVDYISTLTAAQPAQATGNVNKIGRAFADGNVKSKLEGKTLVGELGPELAVYNGQYHLLGQNGAEFTNLPDNAIVFNAEQTKGIINGQWGYRGTALADGNVSGPAKAYEVGPWNQTLNNSSNAGSSEAKAARDLGDLEKWFNLDKMIAAQEKKINILLAERELITDGSEYAENLHEQNTLLQEQLIWQKQLNEYKAADLERLRAEIEANQYLNSIVGFRANGQIQYRIGNETLDGEGMLRELQAFKNMTTSEQDAYLKRIGYSYVDTNGHKLSGDDLAKKFFEEVQKSIADYDTLFNEVIDGQENALKIEKQIKDIADEFESNLKDLEQQIYDIIIEQTKKQIEELKDQKELIKDSNDKYTDALSEALSKEKDMYAQQQSTADRESLQRQLSLLRRSGGSALEIANLENQLNESFKNEYFDHQQQAIDSIKEANERQVEALETQIKLQEDALEYQEENGVIWNKVYDVLAGSESEILDFMRGNSTEFLKQSALQQAEALDVDWAKKIGIYVQDRDWTDTYNQALASLTDEGIAGDSVLSRYLPGWAGVDDENKAAVRKFYASAYADQISKGKSAEEAKLAAAEAVRDEFTDRKYGTIQGTSGSGSTGGSGGNNGGVPITIKSSTGGVLNIGGYTSGRHVFSDNQEVPYSVTCNEGYSFIKLSTGQKEPSGTIIANAAMEISAEFKKLYYGMAVYIGGAKQYFADEEEYTNFINNPENSKKITAIKKFSTGGETGNAEGLAYLHKKERVLSAEQTEAFNQLVSTLTSNNPILEFARNYTASMNGSTIGFGQQQQDNSINIAAGAVQINVDSLSSEYDVSDLANDVMDKIYNIAAKSGSRGVTRR